MSIEPYNAIVLACLTEEMGETLQVIGKIGRHGLFAIDITVLKDGKAYDNRADLERELGDVVGAILYASAKGLIKWDEVICYGLAKQKKLTEIHG